MKYFEALFIFLFLSFYYLKNFISNCREYAGADFDYQTLFLWDYAAKIKLFPYKDIFYPYGLLSYFKDQNTILHSFYYLISLILLITIFFLLKRLWVNRLLTYISFAGFLVFIERFTGIETFNRYGIITVASMLLAFLFYRNIFLSKKTTFIVGIAIGLLFPLLNDQGTYLAAAFLCFIILNPILKKNKIEINKNYFKNIASSIFFSLCGGIIGLAPFIFSLSWHKALTDFGMYFFRLSDILLYAKTPFIATLRTPENKFTLTILFLSIFYFGYIFIYKKRNLSLNHYLQISLIFVLVLLEQKNIIRSLDRQITFVALLLLISLLPEFKNFWRKQILLFFVLIAVLFGLPFRPVVSLYTNSQSKNSDSCMEKNIANMTQSKPQYQKVVDKVKKTEGGLVFSFPGDPIFYVLFKQTPPYYTSIYEASPLYAQKTNIQYIEDQKVQYVIYNFNISSIQDGVPDYVRGNLELKYILTNFTIVDRVDNFALLKRNYKAKDFFKNSFLESLPTLKNYLLNVDLANIPRSEGIHKRKFLESDTDIVTFSGNSIEEINNFLVRDNILSKDKVLILTPQRYKNNTKNMSVTFETDDDLLTTVHFRKCDINLSCIINLKNIPLFFKERRLKEINIQKSTFVGEIQIVDNPKNSDLW